MITSSLAGSDTTASALTSILYHLIKNPEAYGRLTQEIDEATRAGQLSYPNVRYNEATKLPYLDACCKEGMRIHPSIGLTIPREVPKGGCCVSGEWLVEGTRVGVNAAVIHRDKKIFGRDAEEFNPDRWIREDAANMDRHMFQVNPRRVLLVKRLLVAPVRRRIENLYREKREVASSFRKIG